MGMNIGDLNEKLMNLWELSFQGEIYRGNEPTGIKLHYGSLRSEAWLTLRGIRLEAPEQLRIVGRVIWGRDNDADEWKVIEDEPILCTFLLLDPRIYSYQLYKDEWEEQADGTYLMRAIYDVTKLRFPDRIDLDLALLPHEATEWMIRWQRQERWISFRLNQNYFPLEVSQEDLPPHYDPTNAVNPDFTVTVRISPPDLV